MSRSSVLSCEGTEEYPAIVQRVAQRHIASYLGITPEALSRIRNRLAKSGKSAKT